jgi:peptide/nickel transport system substrate-binding protein
VSREEDSMGRAASCLAVVVALVALALAPVAGSAQSGQLSVGLAAEPSTLDPHLAGEIPAHNIARNVYDTLLVRDESMRLAPSLAESWRLVSPTTYQFKLRRNVKFHNGEPFNAASVKFSIERQMNHPKSRAKAALAPVERVEVVDEYTVNVVSKGAFPVLLARNTYAGSGSVVMLPPKYAQEKGDDGLATHPVGTGAFKFVEWVKGDHVTLEANPDYWRARPRVQRVTFRFVPETATRIASLLNGETDIVENVPPDQVDRVANSPGTTIGKTSDGMIVVYYQFDIRTESPVKNRKVREAINHAIDWDTIVRDLLRGHARRRPVPLDPGDGVNPALKTYAYDPERAKKLLAEAGYGSGFSFTMPTSNGRYMQDRAVSEAIAAYLGKVGIKATVQPTEWGVYLKSLAEKRTGPVFVIGWGSGLFDSDVLVDEFGCKVTYSTYCNEQVEDLLQKARGEANAEARAKLYHRAQELLVEDAAFAGAYQPAALFGIGKRVDWKPTIGELIFLWNAGVR